MLLLHISYYLAADLYLQRIYIRFYLDDCSFTAWQFMENVLIWLRIDIFIICVYLQ